MAEGNVPVSSDDIPELTPDDRLRAVAAIFAAGISRLNTLSSICNCPSDVSAPVIRPSSRLPGWSTP